MVINALARRNGGLVCHQWQSPDIAAAAAGDVAIGENLAVTDDVGRKEFVRTA